MLKRVVTSVFVTVGLFSVAQIGHAIDLVSVYQAALKNAPILDNYTATKNAAFDGYYAQLGTFLPSLNATATGTGGYKSVGSDSGTYTQVTAGLGLTQQLVDFNNWGLSFAGHRTAMAAQANYFDQRQSFILTIAKAYFAILDSQDKIKSDQAAVAFYKRTLDQTRLKYEAGLSTSSDVKQALANYDTNKALLIQNKSKLQVNISELAKYTGTRYHNLSTLKSGYPFVMPVPNNLNQWVKQAEKGNFSLQAAQLTADASRSMVVATVGNQLPKINLVGNYGFTKTYAGSNGLAALDTTSYQHNWSVAVQLTWSIFNGGTLLANSFQAGHQYESDSDTALQVYRNTVSSTKQDFRTVQSDIAKIEARKQAVISDQASLKQLEEKYKVGTETIKDVLDQARNLYADEKAYSTAQYTYITDLLTLYADAGSLAPSNLKAINKWLQAAPIKS